MPYIYRYIDLEKEEVVYIGKITKYKDIGYDPLRNRHEQHSREEWYKNNDNLVMQYIELENQCDADVLETWLINFYDTGQLINKAKTGWGRSNIDMWPIVANKWRTFGKASDMREQEIREVISEFVYSLMRETEGCTVNIESGIHILCERIRYVHKKWVKAQRLTRFDEQQLFLRSRRKEQEGEGK